MKETKWAKKTIETHYNLPFFELLSHAYQQHKKHFDKHHMELCTLSSIKTGSCPEDCAYCPQSGHYQTGLQKEKLRSTESILEEAKNAKANGAARFCMGAAWKNPPKKDFPRVLETIRAVKALGLETCVTLGELTEEQAKALKNTGLDYYNHNLDTSPEHYKKIITTRTYEDRLNTLKHVANANINICCGGILGLGETRNDRIALLLALAALPTPLKSIPINELIPIPGTPLANQPRIDPFEFIKTIAIARLMFPNTTIRLSAGRENMSEEMQAFCFMAGANSIFTGDKLFTAKNPSEQSDWTLLKKLSFRVPAHAE